MAWNIEGSYFENCNCNVICPCITTDVFGPADNDTCDVILAFHVDSGSADGMDMAGRDVALVARAPKIMSEGNWKVGVVIDDKASDAQADVLAKIFGGEMGGPMAAFAPLIGEILGVERAPITHRNEGTRHSLTVGNLADIVVQDYVPAGMSEPARLTGVNGPASSTVTVARSERGKVNAFGLNFDNTGKNGHAAPFSWSG